jgi:hypothetical protein
MPGDSRDISDVDKTMSKLAIILGLLVLAIAIAAAPMPLTLTLENPIRNATIYPNLLFAVPLILLGSLLVLYGITAKDKEESIR